MKTTLIFTFLFLFFQTASAQLSAFYTTDTKTNFNDDTGYNILKANETEGSIFYKNIYPEVIDIEIIWTFDKRNNTPNDAFSITFGKEKNVTLQHKIAAGEDFIIQDGKSTQVNFINGYSYKKTSEQRSIMLRITPEYIQVMQTAELGGVYFLKPLYCDTRTFTLKAQANFPIDVKTHFLEYHFPRLDCVAKSNLSLRASNSLSSKKIGSILYGDRVIVLNKTAQPKGFSQLAYNEVVDTKGNLKVEDLSSQMIKVLYKGQIGYAYGGYLLPIRKYNKNQDENYFPNLGGWTNEGIVFDQMFENKALAFKKVTVDFRQKIWQGLSISQRTLVLKRLFPNLKMFQNDNYKKVITAQTYFSDDEEEAFPVRYADYKHVEYIENEIDEELTVGTFHFNKNEPVLFEYKETYGFSLQKFNTATTAYITATSLNMRQTSDPKSPVITKIPFGQKVEKRPQSSGELQVIGGVHGFMQKIKYNNQTGYVFDAYLSPINPPQRKMNPYEINKMIGKSKILDHYSDNGPGRDFCEIPHYAPDWQIVKARDKHQVIKAFRKTFPNLELLKFNWDEAHQKYKITSKSDKISIYETANSWCITVGTERGYEQSIIIIETIGNHIQKVTVTEEFMGD